MKNILKHFRFCKSTVRERPVFVGGRPVRARLGFTLIEIIVSLTILSIVLISVFQIYSNIIVMSKRLELGRSLQQNARSIVETIARDVREGGIAFECYSPSTTSPV